jgi:hypothetical protein
MIMGTDFSKKNTGSEIQAKQSHSRCRTADIGLEVFLECLENNSNKCICSIPFEGKFLCKWPLLYSFLSGRKSESNSYKQYDISLKGERK